MQLDLRDYLSLITSGKVREIYEIDESTLLFVATDRISAYDVVMNNAIGEKGAILTQLSAFWCTYLQSAIPSLRTHIVSLDLPSTLQQQLPPHLASELQRRSMVVKRLKVFPLESIVRGYLSGSAWSSYQKDGRVHGMALAPGLRESEKLDQPLWTPSTKAEAGEKDENISPAEGAWHLFVDATLLRPLNLIMTDALADGFIVTAAQIVGKEYADQIATLSLQIYEKASAFAAERGIIIADTKFEFALDESTTPPSVVLVDEVLTPDSSRFWSAESYQAGQGQDSYDKQYLRDWLVRTGQKGEKGVEMPDQVVSSTIRRYKDAWEKLVGTKWDTVPS
ncbi:MAG: phosphoribosylaminoimidazole carboxylase ade2 [Sclerophora amabilis]|nr:MAG: phosphoribosylaminoimidazole carboxylase ade2 [Sclerophora amabilis]